MADKYWLGNDSGNEGNYGTAANWTPSGVPVANDNVFLIGSQAVTSGFDQSAVELDDFIVSSSMSGKIGLVYSPLQVDLANTDRFEFAGSGLAFIDVGTAAISPVILNTFNATNADPYGLTLEGSAIATIDHRKGSVRLRGATVTTVLQSFLTNQGADTKLLVDSDATITNLKKSGGTAALEAAATLVENEAGTLTTQGSGAVTTLTVDGGTVYPNSSGTITTLNANGGVVDFTRSRVARTVTTLNLNGGSVIYDPSVVTITNAIGGNSVLTIESS